MLMKISSSHAVIVERYRHYLFLFILLAVYFFLDYETILFLPPQGLHFVRQTDCLSFVANYYKHGYPFFEPHVFNLQSTGGRAACEFPVLYYLTALLYRVFGDHDFILRLITLLIVSMGFYYLFKLMWLILQDIVYAMAFSFLFFSSGVLLYNTNNFLPDAIALGFTLAGWYFFVKGMTERQSLKPFITGFTFFSIASLLKVTFFINPITAILTFLLIEVFGRSGVKGKFNNCLRMSLLFLVAFFLVLGWNLYVIWYNKKYFDFYFLVQPNPIWVLDKKDAAIVWSYIANYWYSSYYYQTTIHVLFLIMGAGILFFKKANRILLTISAILVIGSVCYFLLFFAQFRDHDYYFIALIPAVIFLTTNAFVAIKNKYSRIVGHKIPKILLAALCVLSLNHASGKIAQRYQNKEDSFALVGEKLGGMRPYLDSIGVSADAKIIVMTDQSPNGGLYFLRRSGWNIRDTSQRSLMDVDIYIGRGADYIVFTDKKWVVSRFQGIKAGEKNGVLIYRLNRAASAKNP